MEKIKNEEKAAILIDALPYMIDFSNKTMVVSYTCSDILTVEQEQEMMLDLSILHSMGIQIVMVHDTRMGADKFRENKRLAKLLEFNGVKAIGVCGIDEQTLHMTLDNGYIPVITPNDIDTEYENLNPMDTALQIAELLDTEKLLYVGRFDGAVDETGKVICTMRAGELKKYMAEQELDPRLRHMFTNALEAVGQGICRVHVLNGRIPHALLVELFSIEGIGTAIMSDDGVLYHHEKMYFEEKKN